MIYVAEIIVLVIIIFLICKVFAKKSRIGIKILISFIMVGIFFLGNVSLGYIFEKPVFTLNGESSIDLKLGDNYKDEGAKAIVHNKDISHKIIIENNVNTSKVGIFDIIYTLNYRYYKEEIKRTVNVKDKIAPELKLKGKDIVSIEKGEEYKEDGFIAIDNYDGNITEKVEKTKEIINENRYKIVYSVKDSSGNEAKIFRIINLTQPKPIETNKNIIYLTFDDGPSLDITPKILDILKEEGVQATFFILNYDNNKEYLVKRIAKEGHSIGIHGYSHNYKEIYKSENTYLNNLYKLQDKIYKSTGIKTTITRFPGGSSNTVSKFNPGIMTRLSKLVLEKGFSYFDWNVSAGDAGGAKNKEQVYKNVIRELVKNRANVILMHDFSGNTKTLNALRDIIRYGKANGYVFKSIKTNTPMVTQRIAN